ncbi:ABC transporter ATP-binding protein [Microbacterium sp. No. 7]|uniref:ABC transporter ATP-binding protein n=1 Tax=Microbacterium sp. No. 7 TaxID=1714373 RepID=UPI0006D15BF9|nr:ABC transporter ATP-binding protein [Microbacterium sp. No. 7]ALJ22216.1 hypothetical protein AOA12_20955 [Microbacterium sp. No. 7]
MIRTLLRLGSGETRRSLWLLLVLVTLAAVLVAAILALLVPLIEALLSPAGSAPRDRAPAIATWIAALGVAFVALEWVISMIVTRGAMQQIVRLHAVMAEHIVRLPLGWFTAERAGGVAAVAARGIPMVAKAPSGLVRSMARGLLAPALTVAALCVFDPVVGGLAVLGVLAVVIVYRRVHRANHLIEREVDRTNDEGSARILEFAQHQPAVRAAGRDSLAERAVRASVDDQAAAKRVSEDRRGWGNTMMNLTVYAFLALSTVAATARLFTGALAFEAYVALVVVLTVLAGMVLRSLPFGRGIELSKNVLADLDAILSSSVLPEPDEATAQRPKDAGIAFEHVDFGYAPGRPVLRDVSIRVPAGRTTAIVGPSGSGKSTLLRLIARFWDVDGGAVRIGGADVRHVRGGDLLGGLSMVFQEVYLFEGGLLDNIRLGRPGASDDEARRAADLAGVTEIAARLPKGFDTPVGAGGATLSGGERQRLSIARALLKDAPILLLDEATSALDIENEQLIQRGLAALRGERTVVMVAHRLSFIRDADHIVVLDGRGGVEAQGGHDELLAQSPTYARFCSERTEATEWTLR